MRRTALEDITLEKLGGYDDNYPVLWKERTMYPQFELPVSYAGIIFMIISVGTIISSLQSDRMTKKLGTGKVTAISVALTAFGLFGFSISGEFWMLCLWAISYGLRAGSVESIAQKSVIKVINMTPKASITLTTFRNEAVNIRIPFQISAEGMENHNKTWSKIL